MFCWSSETPKQTLVCIWPALLPIVSARSIAVILSEDFRRLNLSHCCDVFGLVADRGRKRTEPCRWSTLRPRTSQWSQYDSIWMRTAKCLQGMTTATSKKESSCFPPCEGYESNNADLSSTANQGVIAGANTTNIGFTPLPHIKWQCNWLGLRLWSWSFWSKRIFRSTKRIPWPQQRVAPAGRRNIKAATSRVTPSNVVRKLGFSNSWFCRSFQLLREEDNWQHSTRKFWGKTCDFSKSTRLWTRLTLVQFFLSWSGRFKGPAIKKQTTAKSGNVGLGATSQPAWCATSLGATPDILRRAGHSKVLWLLWFDGAQNCTNHELLCFTGRGFKICASDVTRVRPYALKNHKDAWSMASNENGNPSESRGLKCRPFEMILPFVAWPYRWQILRERVCLLGACRLLFPKPEIAGTNSEGFSPWEARMIKQANLLAPSFQAFMIKSLAWTEHIHELWLNYVFRVDWNTLDATCRHHVIWSGTRNSFNANFRRVSEIVASWMSMQLIRKASTGVNATTLAPYL